MGFFGNLLGGLAGSLGSQLLPIPGVNGKELGSAIGGMLPFARGGVVPMPVRPYRKGGMIQRKKKGKGRK
jgi:hypothetical protein